MHGIIGGSKGKDGKGTSNEVLKLGHQHAHKHIFSKNDVDTFIHTWSVKEEKDIRSLYKPAKMIAEPQIQFKIPKLWRINPAEPNRVFNVYSKWYSVKQSLDLCQQHEQETGARYDCIMVTRFDTAWQVDILFSQHDMKFFYVPKICMYYYKGKGKKAKKRVDALEFWRNHDTMSLKDCVHGHKGWPIPRKWGFWDCWFFGNPKLIKKLGLVYENLKLYANQEPKLQKRISNHLITELHLEKYGILDKVKFYLHYLTDTPVVRYWYAKRL
jgi:hypothetical protein